MTYLEFILFKANQTNNWSKDFMSRVIHFVYYDRY
jgi:hypothetical protein